MLTTSSIADRRAEHLVPALAVQKVVIVNGNPGILDMVETALDAGHYDVVFVESIQHAYSQIKRVQPHLVILCLHVDDVEGFQVLSMLKLDEDTRSIPVLTYTTPRPSESDEEAEEPSESDALFAAAKPAALMN